MIPFFDQGALAEPEEYEHVQEVHAAEDEDDGTDLKAEQLYHDAGAVYLVNDAEGIDRVTDIDEVKTDQEQVIDRLGEVVVAVEDIDQEHLSVTEKRTGNPDGQRYGDHQVAGVENEDIVHKKMF